MMDHPGNPLSDGTTSTARGVAELMAALIMAIQYYRQSQEAIRSMKANSEAQHAALEDRRRAIDARQWRHALDKGWMRTAVTDELIHVWAAAFNWQEKEVDARQAVRLAETRLEQVDAELMTNYRRLLDDGRHPLEAMWTARRFPEPPPSVTPAEPSAWAPTVVELGPASEPWEAGPVPVPELTRGAPLELGPGSPWEMGATGWTDAEQAARIAAAGSETPAEVLLSAASGAVDVDTPQAALGGLSVRQRLAVAASLVKAEENRSPLASQADVDRGIEPPRPAGTPLGGEPLARPIVAGPGAGFSAVRTRGR